jgi:hypothetical protein
LSQAQSDLLWIKKTHERLYAEWVGKYSEQKSDKKREGEAEEILNFFFNERMKRDEIFNLIKNKYDLLNSKLELVSRKITIALDNRKIFAGVNAEHDSNTKYRAEFKKKKDNTEFELPKMSEDSNLIDRLLEE